MSMGDDALIPVRMLVQYAYCKRLSYMEWVQGEFEYSADVLDGKYKHRNVDKKSTEKAKSDNADHSIHARSITLSDGQLGLISKMDLVEAQGDVATPVEYKRGSTPATPNHTYEDHAVQVCAQGLILRANGYTCTKGMVYYVDSRQRIEVALDDELVSKTKQMVTEMREMAKNGIMPPPLVDSPKCPRCSLVGICLPDETRLLSESKITQERVRRMYPMRSDAVPLYVQEQGAYVSKSGDCIHVKVDKEVKKKIRLIDVSEVILFGNVQMSTQTVRELCSREIPVCYMSYGGWFVGMATGMDNKNIELRMAQHRIYEQNTQSMNIARAIVFGKIRNCMTMLKRNHVAPPEPKLAEMERLAEKTRTIRQYDALLGLEGMAARIYFGEFAGMIKTDSVDFKFMGRNRRPPKDPVNAILSFLYAILTRQATTIARTVGLDPYLGFLHRPKYGKPALALDLIEEFRPIIADSVCITMINSGEITEKDMIITDFGVNLTSTGRRVVIGAYERRMDSSITHPLLGYSASYRRIMETQARLLSRHLLGEIPAYPAFRTR